MSNPQARPATGAITDAGKRPQLGRRPALAYPRCMPADDDAELIKRYAEGDHAAFDRLYHRHKDGLYRYLLRLAGNPDAAADLFQDVWSKVVRASDRYRPSAKFTTWLYRIAHNAFIDRYRRNRRYGAGDNDDADRRANPAPGPDRESEQLLFRERLLQAVSDLPDAQKDAWLLHAEGGLSVAQIADITGVSAETAKSRLRYAMDKLRAALGAAPASREPAA